MIKKSTKFFSAAIAILGGIALILVLYHFKVFWTFDQQLQDKLFIEEVVSRNIVIIGIDDDSIQEYGQWPWQRQRHAQMIDKLIQANVRVIGYDVTFSEKGIGDNVFIEALNNHDNIVFPMEGTLNLRENKIPEFTKVLMPINEIRYKFPIGHSVLVPDLDGKVRKVPFYVQYRNSLIKPFFAQVLDKAGLWDEIHLGNPGIYDYDQYELFRIRYYGPKNTFRTYSFSEVLADDFDLARLSNKIVLVGATANNLHDEYFTSSTRNSPMPGVEIQANLIESYLEKDFIKQVSTEFDYFIHLILLGLIFGICVFAVKMRYSIFIFFLLFILYLIFTAAAFSFDYILPILYPILLMIIIYVLGIVVKYLLESKEKQKIKAGFSQYVAKEVVDELIENPEKLNLGGESRKLTILFSDIRGFTSLSEKLSPQKLVELLNEYLSAMGEVVIDNDGVIDKFIGDAIMAFWGAPIANDNQEIDAVRSALSMIEKLKGFNQRARTKLWPEIKIGIGINSGEVVVGNIGSKKRFDYTAIGDDVNLASRLEGLTKYYGVQLIISEKTAQKIMGKFVIRYLDTVAVKGKKEGVKIYEVLGVESRSKKLENSADEFNRAARMYVNQNWVQAKFVFERLKEKYDDDKPVDIYLQRLEKLIANPPEHFDPVFRADFK